MLGDNALPEVEQVLARCSFCANTSITLSPPFKIKSGRSGNSWTVFRQSKAAHRNAFRRDVAVRQMGNP
jgi:hypothetical protein